MKSKYLLVPLILYIVLPQYTFAETQPSALQNIWAKYKVAIIAAGAGALALVGLGSGLGYYKYSQNRYQDKLAAVQASLVTYGINQVNDVGNPTHPHTFIDIETSGNINAHNSQGDTALHKAVMFGNSSLVRKLLELGADPAIRNNKQESAYNIAENRKFHEPNGAEIYELIDERYPAQTLKQRRWSHHEAERPWL